MKRNTLRILGDHFRRKSLKRHYWTALETLRGLRALYRPGNKAFRRVVLRDWRQFVFGSSRASDAGALDRADAAAGWLARAQDATDDGGVAFGYFPTEADGGWLTSYPETTGYIIASLLDYAGVRAAPEFVERAARMAHWEVDVQLESGAVQGGRLDPSTEPTPAAFNTGMVLHGWARLLEQREDQRILEAARRAADFLLDDMTDAGNFRTNGAFVSRSDVKNYNSLCGWALYLFGNVVDDDRYREAAVRAGRAAMRAQTANGWIENNSLGRNDAVLTHTLGYTLQAYLEIGLLADDQELVTASKRGIDAVIPQIDDRGFLCSWYYDDWSRALFSSCLTGSAQLAIVMYRLASQLGDASYIEPADRLVDFLKGRQVADCPDSGVNGALAGSHPIIGQYMTRGYPNWATKYLLDALLLQHAASTAPG